MWLLLSSGVWGGVDLTSVENTQISVNCMRRELVGWYKSRHAAHRRERLTRCSDVTTSMVGTPDAQKLKLKAMETYGFLLFLLDMLAKYGGGLTLQPDLLDSGAVMVQYMQVVRSHGMNLPPSALQDQQNNYAGGEAQDIYCIQEISRAKES